MPQLIYVAGFKSVAMYPVMDIVPPIGPLQLTQPPDPPQGAGGQLDLLTSPDRAKLTLTRPSSLEANNVRDNCYVGAAVNPFPRDIQYFKVRATFELPTWESEAANYGWAAVVFYRKGDAAYWPSRDDRATVTLRSASQAGTRSARLNTPGQTQVPGQQPLPSIPDRIYAEVYTSNDRARSTFTIEILVDRKTFGIARAKLEAHDPETSTPYVVTRWFKHALITNDLTDNVDSPSIGPVDPDGRDKTDSVGFAVGIASCTDASGTPVDGIATVTISDFRIYRLSLIDVALARFGIFTDWIWRVLSGQLERKEPV